MKKINYTSIFDFKDWGKVKDYESDESTVVLFDKDKNIIAEFGYGGFTKQDLIDFKSKTNAN